VKEIHQLILGYHLADCYLFEAIPLNEINDWKSSSIYPKLFFLHFVQFFTDIFYGEGK
jgi:hypothetical protein